MRTSTSEKVMDSVKTIVCDVFNITREELEGDCRLKQYAVARHTYCYLCIKLDPMCTLKRVGESINRDHSTVHNSIKKSIALRQTEIVYAARFNDCLERVTDENASHMQRLKNARLDRIKKEHTENLPQKSLDAIALIRDFMEIMDQHANGDGVYTLVGRLGELQTKAVEKGF